MDIDELDRLERDLDAVAGRLGDRVSWEELAPRVRWALRRPTLALAGTLGLIAGCGVAGFWAPPCWMVAGGLLLAVLPDRVHAVRERRRTLAMAGEGELLELVQREARRRLGHHFTQALLAVLFAVLFGFVGALAPDSRPGLVAAAVLLALAAVRSFWLFPRASRALRDLKGIELES